MTTEKASPSPVEQCFVFCELNENIDKELEKIKQNINEVKNTERIEIIRRPIMIKYHSMKMILENVFVAYISGQNYSVISGVFTFIEGLIRNALKEIDIDNEDMDKRSLSCLIKTANKRHIQLFLENDEKMVNKLLK